MNENDVIDRAETYVFQSELNHLEDLEMSLEFLEEMFFLSGGFIEWCDLVAVQNEYKQEYRRVFGRDRKRG